MIKYDIFHTVRGWAGVAFNETGLIRLALPGEDRETILAELETKENWQEVSGTRYAKEISRYFNGEKVELNLPIDWSWCTPFQEKVLRFVKEIPHGKVETYGTVAEKLGNPKGPRAVGSALARNQIPLVIPCHRVLAAGGKALGGFSSRNGLPDKIYLLGLEGVEL